MKIMYGKVCVIFVVFITVAHAAFLLSGANLIGGRSSGDDDDLGVMEVLEGFGDKLFRSPDNRAGEEVSKWTSGSVQNPEELGTYVQGDILFPPPKARNGLKSLSSRWPGGRVAYVFKDSFPSEGRSMIMNAISEYHKKTCVRFVPRTTENDYIEFTSGNTGCWSSVGRVGGPQQVNLQYPGCLSQLGTPMHEMMHALGFLHEQNRWERDDFVTVNYGNIQRGRENNFDKATKAETDAQGIDYDYGSVMHYSSTAFSSNGQPTIVAKQQGVTLGQRNNLSHQDLQKIRRMYKCKKSRH